MLMGPAGEAAVKQAAQVKIALDVWQGHVRISFPEPLQWLAVSKDDAIALGKAIIDTAGQTSRILLPGEYKRINGSK